VTRDNTVAANAGTAKMGTVKRDARRSAARFREMLASERQSAALYRGLAASTDGERRQVFLQLADVEDRHAAHWADKLAELGEPVPTPGGVGLRGWVLTQLAKRFSVDTVLPLVERAEHADADLV